jgi:RNA 2',3'-cyclic 3'-phosphodiesterase
MRCFFAVMMPVDVQQKISNWLHTFPTLLTLPGWRWQAPATFHFTLRFLSHVSVEEFQRIKQHFAYLPAQPGFNLTLTDCVLFPNSCHPKAIALGIRPCPALAALAELINTQLTTLGFTTDPRAFAPHLTLARNKQATHQTVELPDTALNLSMSVTHWQFMQSFTKPSGAEYHTLIEYTNR